MANQIDAVTGAFADQVAAYMPREAQGVAIFLGGGDVAIIHDDGTQMGTVNSDHMGAISRAVVAARLRAITDFIETAP